jgi:hypothetical protein
LSWAWDKEWGTDEFEYIDVKGPAFKDGDAVENLGAECRRLFGEFVQYDFSEHFILNLSDLIYLFR